MNEPFFGHEVVGFEGCLYIFAMNAYGSTHEQVLRALNYFAVHPHQIGTLKRFEPEIVEIVVAVVDDGGVEFVFIFLL